MILVEQRRFAKRYGLSVEDLPRLGEFVNERGDFRIDYYHPITRKKTGMYRVRLAGVSGPGKYRQPGGTLPEAYFSPLADWPEVIAQLKTDKKPRILVAEGELKSNKACKEGFPCIGLGGAFSFASKKQDVEFLPTLGEHFDWKDVPTYLAYDSDTAENKMVELGATRLALRLLDRGAIVYMLHLPTLPDGTKCGLDDYLIGYGPDSLKKLMDEAKPWDKDLPLHAMNTEVAYCHKPNCVVRLNDLFVMNTRDFRADHYANRLHLVGEPGKERRVPTADQWWRWENRLTVDSLTFAPGQELITDDQLNLWTGWGGAPGKGDISGWEEILAITLKDARPENLSWFREWAAYRFQHPQARINSGCIFWGPPGTGKTMLGEYIAALHGEPHVTLLSQSGLSGDFNPWMKNKTFILGDEVATNDNRRSIAEEMKNWITRDTVTINEKHIRQYVLPNYTQYFLTSNHHNALALDKGDRRYFVHEVKGPPGADPKTFERLGRWKRQQKNINALLYHFMYEVDCAGFIPHSQPPMTQAKTQVIRASMSDAEMWVGQLAEDADNPEHEGLRHLYTPSELLSTAKSEGGRERWNPTSLGWALKNAGFELAIVKVPGQGARRLYLVRERDLLKKMSPKELAALYLKEKAMSAAKYDPLRRPRVMEGRRTHDP